MVTLTFQQNVNGYTGTIDTTLKESAPTTAFGTATVVDIDTDTPSGSGENNQGLLRFSDIFGSGSGQIPLGSTIISAQLELNTTNAGAGSTIYKMLKSWSAMDTWSSLVSGIQANGVEAASSAELTTGAVAQGKKSFDVTASLQAWSDGQTNNGWAFLGGNTDRWEFQSAEGSVAPKLTVTYQTPTTAPSLGLSGPVSLAEGNSGATPFTFTVTRSGDTSGTISASYAVTGSGTNPATAADFTGGTLPSGTISFAAGETSKTITVNVAGDTTSEPSETFTLTLSNPSAGATITTATSTGTIQNDDTPPPTSAIDDSYIATTLASGRVRNLEHANASKSFYHDGHWWAVLPNTAEWKVHRFDGPLPSPGTKGGWTEASPNGQMQNNNRNSDIAWDDVNNKLYVLQYYESSSKPKLYKLGYDAAQKTFSVEADIQLAGEGGKLAGSYWGNNTELVLGLDQNNHPLVAAISPAQNGTAGAGLHLAYATTNNLSTWAQVTVDPEPTSAFENSKADIVAFTQGGVKKIGIAYSSDGPTDSWKFASHNTESLTTNYANNWNIGQITSSVAIDNHMSAVSDGTNIYVAMKDDDNAMWLTKGQPGNWGKPVKVVNGGADSPAHPGSRETLVLDHDNDQIYVFYQENWVDPYGDIRFKKSGTASLSFNPADPGTVILKSDNAAEDMIDPQLPYHSVGADTGGKFFVFAKNQDVPEVWYNDIDLGAPSQTAESTSSDSIWA